MATTNNLFKLIIVFIILFTIFTPKAYSQSNDCNTQSNNSCNDKAAALPLKIIAIFSILVTSMIGVCLPLFTKKIPALQPDRNLFVIVKSFAAGIILATGFMHVLPDSFDMLWSDCLKENPWHKFPFTGFVAMLSAIVTLMVDSMATAIYSNKCKAGVAPHDQGEVIVSEGDQEMAMAGSTTGHFHAHHHGLVKEDGVEAQLLRYRVVAMVRYNNSFIFNLLLL